jgi:hypothetical protein
MIQEDRIISEFLESIGPWNECVIIGGGFALFIYKLYFAEQKSENFPVGTRDIDSLISRKVPELSKKSLAKHLIERGFTHNPKDRELPATESYIKKINGVEIEIEFLTDSATRGDKDKNVIIAGIVAQPLSYLTLSLQKTMKFQTLSQKTGRVVSPGAWMFHKGLTFTRRKAHSKTYKDLYGIWYVSTQLGDFSESAICEFTALKKQQPKWFETLKKNLHKWSVNASPSDWSKLESQDPAGKLKKISFERIIQRLMAVESV